MEPHAPTDRPRQAPARALTDKLRGLLLPFPTPFDEGGELDAARLRSNIERWNRAGVSGYVALGSTGERVHLDERERAGVVSAAREATPRESVFVVGVGEQGTRAAVREAEQAARAGADAVLALTPHFYRAAMTPEVLRTHFSTLADNSPVPVILYNIPQNTGVALAPDTIARLAEHQNVVGLKESSGDMVSLTETLRLVGAGREDFVVTTGHAGVFYPALCAGAGGAILAAACAVPRLCLAVFEAHAAGDHARALDLQYRLAPVARAVTVGYGIGGLKAALDLLGLYGGPVREPLRAPDARARQELKELLDTVAEWDGARG